MKSIRQRELNIKIEKHELWLEGKEGGEKADFSNENISLLDLSGSNLSGANFKGACLWVADLTNAKLTRANFSGAEMQDTEICYADLSGADLFNANFNNANLRGANLTSADIRGSSLINANLIDANLANADIRQANLYKATLIGANLDGVISDRCSRGFISICPEEGSFIGWKKLRINGGKYVLAKLLIPSDANRCSTTTRKCRASKARVLEMTLIKSGEQVLTAHSLRCEDFEYHTGGYVYPDSFDDNRWEECSNGIHFFMEKQEAIDYW